MLVNNDSCCHIAALGNQQIVGSAGGGGVHHFWIEPVLHQRAPKLNAREALLQSGAEQHDLRLAFKDFVKMAHFQLLYRMDWPVGHERIRKYDQAVLVVGLVNFEYAVAVVTEHVVS